MALDGCAHRFCAIALIVVGIRVVSNVEQVCAGPREGVAGKTGLHVLNSGRGIVGLSKVSKQHYPAGQHFGSVIETASQNSRELRLFETWLEFDQMCFEPA